MTVEDDISAGFFFAIALTDHSSTESHDATTPAATNALSKI